MNRLRNHSPLSIRSKKLPGIKKNFQVHLQEMRFQINNSNDEPISNQVGVPPHVEEEK